MDDVVYGLNGWYWKTKDGYAAVVTNSRLLNKRFPLPDHWFNPGEEWTLYLTPAEWRFHRMERLLKIVPEEQDRLRSEHDLVGRAQCLKTASAELWNQRTIPGKKPLAAATPLPPAKNDENEEI